MINILARNNTLLNQFGENITIFPVENGVNIEEGDFVVVNTRTCLATLPKKESGYYTVGRAIRLIHSQDGPTYVICKDGIFKCKNTRKCEDRILKNDVMRACYFENNNTVSLDNINSTKAGTIVSIYKKDVLVKVNVNEGSGIEW